MGEGGGSSRYCRLCPGTNLTSLNHHGEGGHLCRQAIFGQLMLDEGVKAEPPRTWVREEGSAGEGGNTASARESPSVEGTVAGDRFKEDNRVFPIRAGCDGWGTREGWSPARGLASAHQVWVEGRGGRGATRLQTCAIMPGRWTGLGRHLWVDRVHSGVARWMRALVSSLPW